MRNARAATLAALLLVTVGCSPPPSEALTVRGMTESEVCGSSAGNDRFTVGLEWVLNRGPFPVRVTAVRWTNHSGLSNPGFRYFQPQVGEDIGGIGIVDGSPPTESRMISSARLGGQPSVGRQ